jgi:hypothetical protein
MRKKLYCIHGSADYVNTQPADNANTRTIVGFLNDNEGRILTDGQCRDAWLASVVKYGTKPFNGNIDGTCGRGFYINISQVAKKCSAIEIYIMK